MCTSTLRSVRLFLATIFLLFVSLSITQAQAWKDFLPNKDQSELTFKDYQNAFNDYWAPYDVKGGFYFDESNKKVKARGWKQFKRWEWYWEQRVDPVTGEFPSMTSDQAYQRWLQQNGGGQRGPTADWMLMGPTASTGGYAGIGRINCIAYHPSDLNTFWVGAASGGLWRTTDGGSNWTILTDNLDVLGISDILIDPNFAVNATMYIATGDKDHWDTRSVGVLKSTDGGSTWSATGISYTVAQSKMVYRLLMDPGNSNTIVAATSDGVYKTIDGGTNWGTQLTAMAFVDMEYKPGDFNTLYGCTSSGGDIYTSTNGGNSWTFTLNSSGKRVELAVTPASATTVYALICASNNGLYGIYKSTDSGASFTQTFDGTVAGNNLLGWSTNGSDTGGQGWYDLSMAASPADANKVFVGGVNTWGSTDGGTNWSLVNHWYGGGGAPAVHADKHQLNYRSNGDLFECNDGGVYISSNDGSNWTDLTNTMAISQIYKLGVSATVPTEVQIGLQDNGTKLITGGTWSDVRGGDGMECLIDYTDVNTQYNTYVNGDIDRTYNHWASSTPIQPAGSSGAWVTPYIIDPVDHNTLYAGYQNIYKTSDQGDNWSILFNASSSGRFRAMAIAPSNNQVMYVSDPNDIWSTTDGGANWSSVKNNLPGSFITYIAVKHDDPNTVWVTLSNYNGNTVWESINGGSSWTDISAGLPSIPATTIVQNRQVTSQVDLYVGTDVGIYYKEGAANWVAFNDNLPNVKIGELEFYYDDMDTDNTKLRAATYGRGLWETSVIDETVTYDPCTQLFISEYGEPDGGNGKYIEIYNPTAAAVDLTNYEIWKISNNGTWPEQTIALSGSIGAYDAYVIANNAGDVPGADLYNSGVINFNGDDPIGIAYNGGSGTTFSLIDAVGEAYNSGDPNDPIAGWDVAGVTDATANHTMIRKASVDTPTLDWPTSAGTDAANSEWVVGTYSLADVGVHASDCAPPPAEPCVELFISEYGEPDGGNGKYIEVYNPTAAAIDLANYEIWKISNNGTWPEQTITLSGSIGAYDAFSIANNAGDVPGADLYNSGVINFNGDDPIGIAYNGGSGTTFSLIDAVGEAYNSGDPNDPIAGWDVAGVTDATANHTMIRKASVDGPNTDWASSAGTDAMDSEWVVGTYSLADLGTHTSDCEPPLLGADVTLCVDMNQVMFDVQQVFVSGTYNNWTHFTDEMLDPDMDGVYCITVLMPEGAQEYKFQAYGPGNQEFWEELNLGDFCTVDNNGYVNRAITVVADVPMDMGTVCWSSCVACPVEEVCDNSLNFDGQDDYISLGTALNQAFTDLTVEAWIKVDPGNVGRTIVTRHWNDSNGYFGFNFWYWQAINGNGWLFTLQNLNAPNLFFDGTWHHVAYTYTSQGGGDARVYLDGTDITNTYSLIRPYSGGTLGSSTAETVIGASPTVNEFIQGNMDEVRIWSVSRSELDIQSMMNTELSGTEPGLVYYGKMDDQNPDFLTDCSPSGIPGTFNGPLGSNNLPQYDAIFVPPIENVPGCDGCNEYLPEIVNYGGPNIADPCTCAVFPYFDEEVVVNNSDPNWVWTISSNTGFLDPMTQTEYSVGTPLIVNPNDPTQFTLVGQHVDGIGYDITVQGGPPLVTPVTFLQIDNVCDYPEVSIGQFDGNPFLEVCKDEQGVYLASASAAGPPAVESYGWTFSGNPVTEAGGGGGGTGQLALDGTPRRIGATWDAGGTYTVDLTVTFENACVVDAEQLQVAVSEVDPAIVIQDKEFCYGDPDVTPGLAGTGVRASHPGVMSDPADEVRIVWVLTAKPDNSDYAIGDEFMTPGCGQSFANYGELAVSWSGVIRVNSNAPVNGANEEITGTYEFMAYAENCITGCLSNEVGPFSITVNPTPGAPIVQDITVCEGGDTEIWPQGSGGGMPATCFANTDIVLTGVVDGPLSGGVPKAVELYVINDIPDLSLYGLGVANNGGGTDGEEYTFPAEAAFAGDYIWVSTEVDAFLNYFGFAPTYTGPMYVNGDDAIELFHNGTVIDVFGDINTDGSGTPWEYQDGWAYRVTDTGEDGTTFVLANWTFSGPNALDEDVSNGTSNTPMPIGTYICNTGSSTALFNFYGDADGNNFLAGPVESYDPGTTPATSPQTIWVAEINEFGCESELVPVTVTVYPTPVADAGDNQAYCGLPVEILMNVVTNYPGSWTTTGAGTIDDDTAPSTFYTPADGDIGTTVLFTWTTDDPISHVVCDAAEDTFGALIVPETEEAEFFYALDEYCPGEANPVTQHNTGVDGFYTWDLVLNGPTLQWAADNSLFYSYDGEIDMNTSDWGTYDVTNTVIGAGNLIITGVIDGPLSGGVPKAVELYALADISDLSIYGIATPNNGAPSAGTPEWNFPAGASVNAGEYIWVASESAQFQNFFGFAPTFVEYGTMLINGDDALELYFGNQVIDVFGEVGTDGTGQPWDYLDGWAYREDNTGLDGEAFELSHWSFSGVNVLDGETDNASAAVPFPIASFFTEGSGLCADNTHTERVVIGDLIEPDVFCPSDKEYFLDPGDCSLFLSWNGPDVFDNCPGDPVITQVLGPEPGSEFDLNGSPYTIGYEVYDANGNGPVYCEFKITINGYPEPTTTMACNDEVQMALNEFCEVQMNADMFLEGGPYPCYNEFEVYIDAPGYEGDNVSNEYIALPIGWYWVTTVDAVSGNNCSTYIEVVDKIGPEIVECPIYSMNCYDDVALNEFGYVHPDVSGYPIAEDNCSELVWNYYDEYEELGCASDVHEMVYRHWTVTDMNNGMTDECVQEISINRAGLADLSWPVNFDDLPGHNPMLECNSGFALDANGNPHPSVTGYPEIGEACTTFEMFYTDVNYTSNCGPKILREWLVVDDCTGEIEKRTQIIRITDTTAPSFMLGEDMVLNTKGYECNADFEVPAIMHLEDNCDAYPQWWVTTNSGYLTGDDNGNGFVDADETWFVRDLVEGAHNLCYFAIDNCGNEYSECIEVEVVDNVPPIPVCEQYKQVTLTPDGTAFVNAEDFDSGSFDNCGPVWVKVLRGSEYNNNNELVYDGGCEGLNGDDSPANGVQVWFDDEVGFCCDDLGSEHPDGVMVTMRVFEVDPGPGPVSPYDMYNPNGRLYGKYNDCWSVVQVECKLPPQIVAPPNLQVSCEENLDPYQNTALLPDVISVCGYDLSYEDSDKIGDVCGGRIERTWTAVGCEKSVSFRQYLYLNAAEPFDPCTISFPADETDITCPNDTGEPGYPTWDENPCNIVTAEIINIDTFTFVDDACYKIVVDWAVIDWCVYEPNTGAEDNVDEVRNRKLVCNELIEDGYYRYTQILMVTDVYAPEIQVEDECEALTEGCYAEDVVIEASATDTCNVDQKFWWKYIVTNMDTWETVQYSYNFSPVPDQGKKGSRSKDNLDKTANASLQILDPLGVGNYQVTWSVGDGCGNANTATQYFSVVDKKPPTPFMLDVSTAYMSNCMVEVCAKMFDKGACDGDCLASYDNCSEVLYFTYTDVLPIILHPEWFDADNGMYYFNPETGVQYNVNTGRAKYLAGEAHGWDPAENTSCRAYNYSDLEDGELPPPYEVVQIYVWDQFALNEDCDDGNYDWAEIELYINNDGDCGPEDGAMVVSGSITQAETGEEVDDVVVMLDNNSPEYPKYILSEVGGYAFLGLATGEYELSAEKNDDWGNGVSTLDLVLIQKHLLGIKALDNSYDLIASDANLSGSISAADLFEFRKLILGVEEDLSGGKSWRFVEDSYSFANPMSPWNELEYAEVVDIDLEENVDDANLVGIKLGDINGSAQANARATNLETRSAQSRHLVVNETALEEGELEIGIEAKSFNEVSGMQFTMELEGMSYVGIESGALQVTNNNVGTPKENRVTFSWNTTEGVSVGEGEVLFTLKLNNEREGLLSQRMRMSSALTQAEIYEGEELAIYELGLEVRGSEEANFALYQNEPNPFSAQTSIGFTLPQAGNYELSILDVTGKVVKVEQGEGERGYNVVRMRSEDLPAGLLYYQLESGEYSATKKMILIK